MSGDAAERDGGWRPARSPLAALAAAVVVVGVAALAGVALTGGGLSGVGGPEDGGALAGQPSPTATPSPDGTPAPLPPADPLEGTRSLADADVTVEGGGPDELGYAVAVGDLNGDGTPDLALGAPFHDATANRSGAVFVFYGPVEPGDLTVADADVRLTGQSNGAWAGNSLAVADVDGDGVGDLVVGAPRGDAGTNNAGAAHVVTGGPDLAGTVPLSAADATLAGAESGSMTGYSVAAANLTGDGRADVVVGAPRGEGSPGRVFVVEAGNVANASLPAAATGTLVGEAPGDEAGWRVAVARNVTGEGAPAVVVGAPHSAAAGEDAGAAYAAGPPFDGERALGDAAVVLRGESAGALAGWSVAAPGDVDGDGRPELLVGAPHAGAGGTTYVVDPAAGDRALADADALTAASGGDSAGWLVAGTGDVTCDGTPDVLVGAPENTAGGEDAGAVHVVGGDGPADLANATATLTGAAGDRVGRADAVGVVPGRNATGLVVGAPFGDPATAHVVYAGCQDG